MLGIEAGDDVGDCAVAVGTLAKSVVRFIADGQENGIGVQLVGLGFASKINGRSRADILAGGAILVLLGKAARAVNGIVSKAQGWGSWADALDGAEGGT